MKINCTNVNQNNNNYHEDTQFTVHCAASWHVLVPWAESEVSILVITDGLWRQTGSRLHEPLLFGGCPGPRLLLAVDVEPDGLVGVDVESLLDHLPYSSDGVWLGGVRQPNGQLVSFTSHIDHCTVNLRKENNINIMLI